MKSKIALAALIGLAVAAPAFAQQKTASPKPNHTLAAPTKPDTPGGPAKFASAPGTQGPKSAPPVGVYHYRVQVVDQAGQAAAPKLIDDFAARPKPVARPNPSSFDTSELVQWAVHQ